MAISLISPGIKITEQDLVSSRVVNAGSAGGIAGQFRWGAIEFPTLVTSESDLVVKFGRPNQNNIVDFLSAANFLGYSSQLFVVRTANTPLNATAEATTGSGTSGVGVLVKNPDVYLNTTSFNVGPWIARYAGALGNSLKVSICPSASAWASNLTGTFTVAVGGTLVVGAGSAANTELTIGDYVTLNGRTLRVANTVNATAFTLETAHLTGATAASATRRWEYFTEFDAAPGTSTMAAAQGASGDELHVVVVDQKGDITGTAEVVLEKFSSLSKGSNAKSDNGGTNFYKTVINDRSEYIWWGAHDTAGSNWGNAFVTSGAGVTYTAVTKPKTYSLAGGSDGAAVTDGDKITAYSKLSNKQENPAAIIIAGQSNASVVNRIISDVVEERKDVVACISPIRAAVVNNPGNEARDISTWADTITRSTYVFADSGWKYQYDKYNDAYAYVPLNPDVAGIIARNDTVRDPWLSPAGYANGSIQNLIRLAFNPSQAERDTLYKTAVNPVFTQIGRGTVLFGDKTFTTKSISTNRINVRKLFIEIQKTISDAANAVLFDANDATTRANFVNLIVPYLRSVQARRGIAAFSVVCDERNNTPTVINSNEFVCDIFVQPIRSVNFVQLNFVSVAGAVAFNEVTGG
jgi:outer membrane murein-binding lipoprotein Lpp